MDFLSIIILIWRKNWYIVHLFDLEQNRFKIFTALLKYLIIIKVSDN